MMDRSKAKLDYSILAAIEPRTARPRSSLFYHVSLVLAAVVMLLLPVAYLALAWGAAYAVYYHAVYDWSPIMGLGGYLGSFRLLIFRALLYFAPLVAGVVVVFFMFKPIFARRPKRAPRFTLKPGENPLLYAFIEQICACVGAPSPKRIDLNCDLNASAGFRRGLLSMAGNDLVLTIGLPLVANLTVAEFGGVVAHEFGHFTQAVSMRLGYFIDVINLWFARVVFQRDAWDVALEQWSAEVENSVVAFVVLTAQVAVWFTRQILRLLMLLGLLVAGFLVRQMEYEADTCEIQLAGSETFERTTRKLATLSVATQAMYGQLHAHWKKTGQLPDNLSDLLRRFHENLPPQALQQIEDTLGLRRTRLFDSHPSPADRIRRARQAQAPGLFHDDRPATALFSDFEVPARLVTMDHYACDLGIRLTEKTLFHPLPSTPDGVRPAAAGETGALDEYFLGIAPLCLPLRLEVPAASGNLETDFAELNQIVAGLQQVREQVAPLAAQDSEAGQRLVQVRAAARLLAAGVAFQPKQFGIEAATPEGLQAAEDRWQGEREVRRHSVHEVAAALQRRLQLGLALRLASRGESGTAAPSADQLPETVARLNRAAEEFAGKQQLADALLVMDRIAALRRDAGETPALARALAAQGETIGKLLQPPTAAPPSGGPPSPSTAPLRLAKGLDHPGAADRSALKREVLQWFADYYGALETLVQAAMLAEGRTD